MVKNQEVFVLYQGYIAICFQQVVKDVIKRSVKAINETGGLVRSMDNLGAKQLPYRIRTAGYGREAFGQ